MLDKIGIARRIAKEVQDGYYVNLGIGIPTLVANYVRNDIEVEFELMLPDDDEPLEDRVEGLGIWCQGFVYGLAAGGIKEGADLPEDSEEIIKDILEISRAGYAIDDEADVAISEDDEEAFMEVCEYVRMGVLLVYEELQPLQSSQTVH